MFERRCGTESDERFDYWRGAADPVRVFDQRIVVGLAAQMRLRYQVGSTRFATIEEAAAVAAARMLLSSFGEGIPVIVDRTNRQPCGATELVRACDLLAGKQLSPGDIPTFKDAAGNTHMGISA